MRQHKQSTGLMGAILLLAALHATPGMAGDTVPGSGAAAQTTQPNPALALQGRPGCRMMMGFMAGFNQMMAMSRQSQQQNRWVQTWPWMPQTVPAAPKVVMKKPMPEDGKG